MKPKAYENFVRESNRIEGILRDPTPYEMEAHVVLVNRPELKITDMETFVAVAAPGKFLRTKSGMDVRVGNYIAPAGGPEIADALAALLVTASRADDPYKVHCAYETLHPFMDGNGRSGRALWLWMMDKRGQIGPALQYGFLHLFYYQTLEASDR